MSSSLSGSSSTRRAFLTTGVVTVAGLAAAARRLHAASAVDPASLVQSHAVPLTAQMRRHAPSAWWPELPTVEQFRALAHAAMGAARQAGAEFADIRIGLQRQFSAGDSWSIGADFQTTLGYGIRARVNGGWSAQHGVLLSEDAVVAAARMAVARARAASAENTRLARGAAAVAEMAPVPVATGEWHGPMQIDPFLVPLDDLLTLLDSWAKAGPRYGYVDIVARAKWIADTRVFASTDGALVTQQCMQAFPSLGAGATLPDNWDDSVGVAVAGIGPVSGGYELLLDPDIPNRIPAAAEEAIRLRQLPLIPFGDIGRYPVVFAEGAFATLVGKTISPALDGDRIAGFEADASGGSFLAPLSARPDASAPAFAPSLTVTTHRALPSVAAVGWDDDGVVPEAYTLIDRGTIVDLHTTRDTAPVVSDWYRQRGQPLRSRGCAVATTASRIPVGGAGHVTVVPAPEKAPIIDLIRDIPFGFVLRGAMASASPNVTVSAVHTSSVLVVRHGREVGRIKWLNLSVVTKQAFGAKLVALGDASTNSTQIVEVEKGMPWQTLAQPVTAPAALCKEVDIVRENLV